MESLKICSHLLKNMERHNQPLHPLLEGSRFLKLVFLLMFIGWSSARCERDAWKILENKKQGFSLSYPAQWKVSQSGSQLWVCESDPFCVRVEEIENPSKLSSFNLFKEVEMKSTNNGEVAGLKYSKAVKEKIGQLDAVTLKDVFAYDFYEETTIMAAGDRGYMLSFPSKMAEIKDQTKLNSIARSIVRTFRPIP